MLQYLVSEMKTHTSANAHRLGSVKMMKDRFTVTPGREKKNLRKWGRQLQDYCSQNSPMEWGFLLSSLRFFSVVEIDLFLHSTFLFMLLRHAIKIAIQKSILYLNVRQLRFQLFLSKRAPTENIPAQSCRWKQPVMDNYEPKSYVVSILFGFFQNYSTFQKQ